MADIRSRRSVKAGAAANSADLRKAWSMGEIVAAVPLQHLLNRQSAKTDKAWAAVSRLVRGAQQEAGQKALGLDAIPNFKGSKIAQVKQAIAFIFRQRKTVEGALASKFGERARALFVVSTAGHMAYGLNRMKVPNLNRQLAKIITDEAPGSGLPCAIWVETALRAGGKAEPDEVVAAWAEARKASREFLSES